MTELTVKEEQAIRKAFENISVFDLDHVEIQKCLFDWRANIMTAKNGRKVAWVFWSDDPDWESYSEAAVYVDTLEELTEEEIKGLE